ncbi:MAG TPA: hypothetical protein VHN37_13130 [Actinomycetota bacterium]|nr:hypothetical protein [Actinomycetota bacterium]
MDALSKKKSLLGPVLAGLAAFVVVVLLTFPTGCSSDDAPPGTPAPADACPRASTLSGFVWPNMYAGFAIAPLVALVGGGVVYRLAARSR